ncbi:unnamed protein product [Sphagnum balticum]
MKDPETSHQLKHAVRSVKENEARIMKSLQDIEKMLSKKEGDLESINNALEQSADDLRRLENENHSLDTERVLARIRKNIDVLKIAALQKKYKKLEEITNKTAKLMYS